jgi:P27 family predicted phage terminase small subunit
MGQRGPLKVIPGGGKVSIADAAKGSAAAKVSPLAPLKPEGVAEDPELSQMWDEIVPELDKAGLLSTADVMTVELAVRHMRAIRKTSDDFHKNGLWIDDGPADEDTGYQPRKRDTTEQVFRAHSDKYMEIAKQLGMTWMARARTAVPEENRGNENPFDSGSASTGS